MRASVILLATAAFASAQMLTELQPATDQGFQSYITAVEPKLIEQAKADRKLPWMNEALADRVRNGEIVVQQRGGEEGYAVPEGLVHDYVGAAFFKGVTVAKAAAALQDFAHHKDWYPEIIASQLLSRNGSLARGTWTMKRKKVLTVVLRADIDSAFQTVAPQHGYLISRTKPIIEVADYGTGSQHDYPAGKGHGFLWRFNGYWTLHEADGGVYAECRIISLSRDVPPGLGWIVNPFIRSMPRESTELTLQHTKRALER